MLSSLFKGKKAKREKPEKADAGSPAAPVAEQNVVTDDAELIAVLAAAVASMTGARPGSLVVRSYRRVHGGRAWRQFGRNEELRGRL